MFKIMNNLNLQHMLPTILQKRKDKVTDPDPVFQFLRIRVQHPDPGSGFSTRIPDQDPRQKRLQKVILKLFIKSTSEEE